MHYELTDRFVVRSTPEETWAFFSQAKNLPDITPPWLNFTVTTPGSLEITQDSVIDYTIRWLGIPVKWRTLIIDWSPLRQFIDLQIRGPYALWHHQHTFTPVADGVECADRVIYRLPASFLGGVMHAAIVRKQLTQIFQYRRRIIGERLGWVRAVQPDVRIGRL